AAFTFVGPSAPITFSLPSGILSPALIVMFAFLPCVNSARRAARAREIARLDEQARHGVPDIRLHTSRPVHGAPEGDGGLDPHAPQHIDHILGRYVSRRRRCKRAAAEAAKARIEHTSAGHD